MNKKFKIVSSLVLTGVLTLNSLGVTTLAAEVNDTIETKTVVISSKLVSGKNVAAFSLNTSNDVLTAKEVKNIDGFASVTGNFASDKTLVKTGDTFVGDTKSHTVIVYGDVNKDGYVNSKDALLVEEVSVELKTLDAVQTEAADVKNDGAINSKDSLRIKEFSAEISKSVIDILPAEEVVDGNYQVTVNEDNKINNQNEAKTVLNIAVAKTLTEEVTLTAVLMDSKEVEVTASVKIAKNTTLVEQEIDLSSLEDGKISGKLLDSKDNVVATFMAEKNTDPITANVITRRTGSATATLSLEAYGDSDVTKVYYLVSTSDSNSSAVADFVKADTTKTIEVSNNVVSNKEITNEMTADTAHTVHYVLENSWGSRTAMLTATINAAGTAVAKKVEEVRVPEDSAEFTWDVESGYEYIANLYNEKGELLATETVDTGAVNFKDDIEEAGEGTYTVKVYATGTGLETSEATSSDAVTVARLPKVTGLTFVEDEDEKTVTLKWTNPNKKADFSAYDIKIVELDKDGKEVDGSEQTVSLDKAKNEVVVTDNVTKSNTIYRASVVVVSNDDQIAEISSDAATSEYFKVAAPNIFKGEVTENSVTLKVTNEIEMYGKTPTYKLEIYRSTGGTTLEAQEVLETRNVQITDGEVDREIVVDKLQDNSKYRFILVASVDGKEAKSADVQNVITLPVLGKLTVVASADDIDAANEVFADATTLTVGKDEETKNTFTLSDYSDTTLETVASIIEGLQAGDIVTISDKKVTLLLADTLTERDLGNLKEFVVDVTGNTFTQTITGTVKELILRKDGAIFKDVADVVAEKITLADDVVLTGSVDATYTILPGTVTIGNVKVTATAETEIAVSGTDLTVTANTTRNELTFVNNGTAGITLTFTGSNTSTQAGKITIDSKDGAVEVVSGNVDVTADLDIKVLNGSVTITDTELTGNKTVTVKKEGKATITATTEMAAPVDFANNFVLREYTDEELTTTLYSYAEEDLAAIRNFIKSFGLNGTGATISAMSEGDVDVVITISTELESEVTIGNIK